MAEEKTTEETFEDGKQVEDYLKDLNEVEEKIKIEPEPHPEAMVRMEDIAKPPVRNKPEKKAEAKKQESPETPKAAATVPQPVANQPTAVATVATGVNPQPQTPPQPPAQAPPLPEAAPKDAKSTEQPPTQPAPQPKIMGVDDYIETISLQAGNQRYQEVKSTAYQNINALFQGKLVLVPAQQLQQLQQQQVQPPQPVQAPQEQPKTTTISAEEKLRKLELLDKAMKDPTLKANMREFLKQKCELLDIRFTEDMLPKEEPAPTPVQASPVNPKKASDDKPKKPQKKWSIKAAVALVAVVALAGVGIVLLVGALIH